MFRRLQKEQLRKAQPPKQQPRRQQPRRPLNGPHRARAEQRAVAPPAAPTNGPRIRTEMACPTATRPPLRTTRTTLTPTEMVFLTDSKTPTATEYQTEWKPPSQRATVTIVQVQATAAQAASKDSAVISSTAAGRFPHLSGEAAPPPQR